MPKVIDTNLWHVGHAGLTALAGPILTHVTCHTERLYLASLTQKADGASPKGEEK